MEKSGEIFTMPKLANASQVLHNTKTLFYVIKYNFMLRKYLKKTASLTQHSASNIQLAPEMCIRSDGNRFEPNPAQKKSSFGFSFSKLLNTLVKHDVSNEHRGVMLNSISNRSLLFNGYNIRFKKCRIPWNSIVMMIFFYDYDL